MSLSYGRTESSLGNRKLFLQGLGIDCLNLVCTRQTHGTNIRRVYSAHKGSGALSKDGALEDTDGLITNERNVALSIFTADCLAASLYDPVSKAIGLIHAGWRGTKDGILVKAIKLMQGEFGSQAADMYLNFSPAIKSCCYEVGEEFRDFFPSEVINRDGKFYLDIAQVNRSQAVNCGVNPKNISDPGICTKCLAQDCFSYRRQGKDCGRMISVLMLC
ncbi:peptidoglycan editing factor PgeF [bacterium]|nr:MAG: peptidoglycan editing factor PgeF [bacterium]